MRRFVFAVRSAISTPHGHDVRASAERDYDEAIGNRELRAEHVQAMAELWESGVEVGDDELAKVVNSSLYMVTTGLRADYNFSCCPTGLASNGWTGVAFADCELWHEPPMLMLQPNIAKSMRAFRYNGLAHALANAKRYGKCTLSGSAQ